jgi:hypothetical protein
MRKSARTLNLRNEHGKRIRMTAEELARIRSWDERCGDNEGTFFPVTIDRRRLLEYVDELRAEVAALTSAHPLNH